MKISGTGYIACAHFEESIHHFGEAESPEKALADFVDGDFADYCDCRDIEDEEYVEVRVFKAIYNGSPEWNDEDYDPDWDWVLGEQVDSKQIQYLM